jgi:hypothetical protein
MALGDTRRENDENVKKIQVADNQSFVKHRKTYRTI